jgi:hypothetical protein
MYTKFILVIAFLFLVPATVSMGSRQASSTQPKSANAGSQASDRSKQQPTHATPVAIEFPNDYTPNHPNNHHPDEDHKSHLFDFSRLNRRRFRLFWALISKLILLITHVCSLFSLFIHLCHR